MIRRGAAFLLLLAGAPAHAAATAAGFEDLTMLEDRLVAALGVGIGVPGGPATHIDGRLKLRPCPAPATIDPPALGAIAIRCQALGWRIRVPLMVQPQPAPVRAAVAAPRSTEPPAIKRGDPVELVAGAGGFIVSTSAIAQEDGRVGGRIRVRPDARTGSIVIGQVEDGGRVRVTSF